MSAAIEATYYLSFKKDTEITKLIAGYLYSQNYICPYIHISNLTINYNRIINNSK